MERTINRRASRLQERRHFQKEAKNYALQKNTISILLCRSIALCFVDFRDYVEICNSSVDGFTQHVSYFSCTID